MDTMSYRSVIEEKIRKNEESNRLVNESVPEKYQPYVLLLEKSEKISNSNWEKDIDKDQYKWLKDHGVYVMKEKTYLKQKHAYFPVAGRLAQLVDFASEYGYSYTISKPEFQEIKNVSCLVKEITVYDKNGKILRQSAGLASIGFNGSGVDATNPLENAETSALGRALSGIGMGTRIDIASAEEIEEAERRKRLAEKEEENEKTEIADFSVTEESVKEKNEKAEDTKKDTDIKNTEDPENPIYQIEDISDVTKGTALWKTVSISDIETGETFNAWVLPQKVELFNDFKAKDKIHAIFRDTMIGKERMRLFRDFRKAA